MSNIIAVIWDFDKTLVDGNMQDPIFEEYGVDSQQFWDEVGRLPQKYLDEQNVRVNKDTIYLNHFIEYAKNGRFSGLNNARLKTYGPKQKFYPGVEEFLRFSAGFLEHDPKYKEYGIQVEHYIVSTGMKKIIEGTSIMPLIKNVWGCELIEETGEDGQKVISEVGYTIDNTSKTRAIFEINKGVGIPGVTNGVDDVNISIPQHLRRVKFENMIYVADGPSDIPAFSVVHQGGGATFAVYPKNSRRAFEQIERMRAEGRVDMYSTADYQEGSTAYLWITGKIREKADKIVEAERKKIAEAAGDLPRHLNS